MRLIKFSLYSNLKKLRRKNFWHCHADWPWFVYCFQNE